MQQTGAANLAERTVATSRGSYFVRTSEGEGLPLLMVHGNSSCHRVFERQLTSPRLRDRSLIAIDLLGHGRSSVAQDPDETYSLPGMAKSVIELLEVLGIDRVAILGWSLGGNITMEMLVDCPAIKGAMLVGAPPVRGDALQEAFKGSPGSGLPGRRKLSRDEAKIFAHAMFGEAVEDFLVDAIMRTDGQFRETLFAAARAGAGIDQRALVETRNVPLAVVNGDEDPLLRLEYFDSIAWANLWSARCYRLADAGHAPFWGAADRFNELLDAFLRDVEAGEASRSA